MKRVAIAVEGETEEEFVKQLLSPHLVEQGILVDPVKPWGRGGNINVDRLAPHMAKLSWNFDAVTSLVDFYRFGRPQPGETIDDLTARIDAAIGNHSRREPRVTPQFAYVQQYELEALLFSDPSSFGVIAGLPSAAVESLGQIAVGFGTPEDINDGDTTAPSKRVERCFKDNGLKYEKRLHGPAIAKAIGLVRIREECPRFDGWVARLEAL